MTTTSCTATPLTWREPAHPSYAVKTPYGRVQRLGGEHTALEQKETPDRKKGVWFRLEADEHWSHTAVSGMCFAWL